MARFVYCFTNPEMPDLVKIGKTDNVEGRLKQLSGHAGVPVAFECPIALEVENADQAEKLLHEVFRGQRINSRREFFRVGVEHVRAAMLLTGGRDATPTSDVVEDEEEQVALNKARKKRERFNFGMVDIEAGAKLEFRHLDILNGGEPFTAEVVSHTRVLFGGEETSLSAAARSIMQRNGVDWAAKWSPTGPLYWYYEGESLDDRRRRLEDEGAE